MSPKAKNNNPLMCLSEVNMQDVITYQMHEIGVPYIINLKVPKANERFLDDHKHYTKSNINVCYASPRNPGKPRNWFETQLTVSKEVRETSGYPLKGVPFYVVTDDGYGFLAHTTSQNNKQFAAVGDELILGKWIKGRLINNQLIKKIDDTEKDKERLGMITAEMLEEYGCNAIAFQKTDMRINNPVDVKASYEVWTLKMIFVDNDI